jgi:hypothetical protein
VSLTVEKKPDMTRGIRFLLNIDRRTAVCTRDYISDSSSSGLVWRPSSQSVFIYSRGSYSVLAPGGGRGASLSVGRSSLACRQSSSAD